MKPITKREYLLSIKPISEIYWDIQSKLREHLKSSDPMENLQYKLEPSQYKYIPALSCLFQQDGFLSIFGAYIVDSDGILEIFI
jgi:hypothetical protein